MAVNLLDVNQAATILAAALSQAQGGAAVATPLTTADFVTVQQTVTLVGFDALNTAISQVLDRTIFSARPYDRKLRILEADATRWGAITRKVNYVDDSLEADPAYTLANGQSIDMQVVKKPHVIESKFYGFNTFDYHQTIYKQQLQPALRGPEEWAGFLGGLLTHIQNLLEKTHEESARMCVANMIGATAQNGVTSSNVQLVTEFNAWEGASYTNLQDIVNAGMFSEFARFAFARIQTISKRMEERQTDLYHIPLPDLAQNPITPPLVKIPRATNVRDQRLIVFAPAFDQINTQVLTTLYNTEYMRLLPHEEVSFWQNIQRPSEIVVVPSYMNTSGVAEPSPTTETVSDVLAVLYDKDAMGYTTFGESYEVAPYNVRGKYWNHFWSFQDRYWNDQSENVVVFTLT